MFLRQFAVALAVTLPLTAQVADTAPLTRLDVVVADEAGHRVRGLTAVDFEILENNLKRGIDDFYEYAPEGKAAEAVSDPRFVPLVTPASPTPPRRVVLIADQAHMAEALQFIETQLRRPGDVVRMDDTKSGDLTSRIAATAILLARYPEKKAIVVFGEIPEAAKTFANKRGVAVITPDAVEDLSNYYSLSFHATGGGSTVLVKTTRPFAVRTVLANAALLADDPAGDTVLAQHFVPSQSNDLGIALNVSAPVAAGTKRQVKLQVLVPIRNLTLTPEGSEVTGGFDVLTSIGDGKGRFSRVQKQTHAIRWPAEAQAQAGDRNINYSFDVVLEPGSSVISVGVVDQRSKKTGFQRIEVSG